MRMGHGVRTGLGHGASPMSYRHNFLVPNWNSTFGVISFNKFCLVTGMLVPSWLCNSNRHIMRHLQGSGLTLLADNINSSLYPRHTKYVEGYIVFVFLSVGLLVCPCVHPVLTFYVKVLREVFFIHQEMALAGGIRAPLGTCSSSVWLSQYLGQQ